MVVIRSNNSQMLFTAEDAQKLKNECDRSRTFTECGYFCVMGWKGRELLVNAFSNSREEYDRIMGARTKRAYSRYSRKAGR
ncbi:hypothetical protein GCM10007094_23090 [Pseudovibrio japonicus]|uniref:Uncharacterized protein n=1 Tax=Pseudovibrio japonicus TaxID=366534 RepID=A0ABQ3ECS0_9HYPH|nr:hypothetical protein GCM10007094_23090 [Pseudovibrio japonicus]